MGTGPEGLYLRKWLGSTLAIGSLTLTGCEQVEQVIDSRRDLTPHEAYVASLEAAGLAESALGQDWIRAADQALHEPLPVGLPYREEGFLPARRAERCGTAPRAAARDRC